MNPLCTSRNKYFENEKNSTVFTPAGVCQFLFDLIYPIIKKYRPVSVIVDPSVGEGNLVIPFLKEGCKVIGYDIDNYLDRPSDIEFKCKNFLESDEKKDYISVAICNPPFNTDIRNKDFLKEHKLGKALLPELFIKQIFNLYGDTIPVALFSPMGFRLNLRKKSNRQKLFMNAYPNSKITSIISLPLDIFSTKDRLIEFHNEILIWNIPELDAHYWLPEKYYY